MDRTVLILGSSGRFGRHAANAFSAAGWEVRRFDRKSDNLWDAAWGASVIVNAWNPNYTDWAKDMPRLHQDVCQVASASGATVILPGNVYNFGQKMPPILTQNTAHDPTTSYGQLRVDMEAAYREAKVRTIVLRAGDFIDTQASGNWFDMVITKPLSKGKISYPGKLNVQHAWAYLPDMAKAAVMLAERRHTLNLFEDIPFAGFTLTGNELAQALSEATNRRVKPGKMSWVPLMVARPFWKLAAPLISLRYLWSTPHSLDGTKLANLIPEFRPTEISEALRSAVQDHVHPHQSVPTGGQSVHA